MVAVFSNQHMGEQPRARHAALNRQRGQWRLRDGFAVAATHLGAGMDDDLKMRGHILQQLALIRADAGHPCSSARRTDAGRFMLYPFPWQMLRQGLAYRLVL